MRSGCVIEDARSQETAQLENGTEYFRYGTALGAHSDLGLRLRFALDNVFLRVDESVLSMRTVSPRGPAGGVLAHDNWFAQPISPRSRRKSALICLRFCANATRAVMPWLYTIMSRGRIMTHTREVNPPAQTAGEFMGLAEYLRSGPAEAPVSLFGPRP